MGFKEDIANLDMDLVREKHKGLLGLSEKHLDSLVQSGEAFDYYGADEAEHEFQLGEVVFKAIEDPQDGYRSSLGAVAYGDPTDAKGIMFRRPIARVRVNYCNFVGDDRHETFSGYRLVDADTGHVWLEFGTENWDDYYPCFVFTHRPAPGPLTDTIPGIDQ